MLHPVFGGTGCRVAGASCVQRVAKTCLLDREVRVDGRRVLTVGDDERLRLSKDCVLRPGVGQPSVGVDASHDGGDVDIVRGRSVGVTGTKDYDGVVDLVANRFGLHPVAERHHNAVDIIPTMQSWEQIWEQNSAKRA